MLSCVHQAHFNRMRVIIVLERSLASCVCVCVCSHDISSPEADALWPRLTPLGDTGLHRQTCIFTVQMIRRQERAFSSYVSENTNEIKKKRARCANRVTETLHVRQHGWNIATTSLLLPAYRAFRYFRDGVQTT